MAYSKQTWNTTSYVTPTRMNHIEEGIAGVKNDTILDFSPTTNETWDSLFSRFRQNTGLLANGFYQYYSLRFQPTSASQNNNLIFTCTRFVANSSIEYLSSRLTTGGIVFYHLVISTNSVALTQIVINNTSTPVTVTDLTSNDAQSAIRVMGLNNNE